MKMQKITTAQAIEMFLNYGEKGGLSLTGVNFSNMTYYVGEGKSKTVKGKSVLDKLVNTNATIGADYGSKVGRILDKEGKEINFVSKPMNGKEYVKEGKPVATDTKTGTKFYLCFIVEGHTKPSSQLFLNGNAVDRADVWNEEYITKANLVAKPQVAGRGLINEENNFHFRTLDFNNLRGFVMNKVNYIIEG